MNLHRQSRFERSEKLNASLLTLVISRSDFASWRIGTRHGYKEHTD